MTKTVKKLATMLLSLSMLPAILPWQSASAAESALYLEDFEGYEVGVISSGAEVDTVSGSPPVRNPGGLCYKLAAGDTLEVVEKDGSRALKITIDNTIASTRSIFLDFDNHYGGSNIYEVSFDYYVENNSVWLPDFGTIYDDNQSNIYYVHNTTYCPIKRVSSFENALYFDGNTATYYAGNLVRSSDAIWRHQKMSIDFTQSPRPFKITTTKTADGTQLATKSMTVNTALNDISSILWRFAKEHKNGGWNAKDSGEAVFYIDNIKVIKFKAPEITNIDISYSGSLGVGTVLSGSYTYYDGDDSFSGENKDRCELQWYRCEDKDGKYLKIDGETGETYTLTAEDEDKYIKLGVTPYSKVEPKVGKEYLSDAFKSFTNNILISGEATVDCELEVEDKNAEKVIWYTSDTAEGEYTKVGDAQKYKIKQADSGKWIKACVIPKNSGAGSQDKGFYSHAVKIAPKKYFEETFEGYDIGTIAENLCSTITNERKSGEISYKLAKGDKLEVVDNAGNKVLKLTANETVGAQRRIILDFDKHYGDGGAYNVSFDYSVGNNSMWFGDFGTLYDDGNKTEDVHDGDKSPIKVLSSFKYALYFDGKTDDHIASDVLSKTDNTWKTLSQKIDLSKSPASFTVSTANGSKKVDISRTKGGIEPKQVSAIVWSFANDHYVSGDAKNWRGQDKDEDTDVYGPGVYYIDNIRLESTGMSVVESKINVKNENVELTFDNLVASDAANYISILKNGEKLSDSEYTVSLSGDEKKIEIGTNNLEYASKYEIHVSKELRSKNTETNADKDNSIPMKNEYVMHFNTPSLIDCDSIGKRQRQGFIPYVSAVEGATCNYFISKDDEAFAEYNQAPLNEAGQYKLKVVATDANGKTQTEIISFEIVGPVAPEARNVNIEYTGTLNVGTVLNGSYTYFDINDAIPNENEDHCPFFQWYRSSSKDSGFTAIEGANDPTYTLTEADEDKYIKFGVKPYSNVAPKEGDEYRSEAFLSFMNPTASNIKINGTMATGEQLTVSYDYFDLNGDAETLEGTNATTVIWYTSETAGGPFSKVDEGRNYTIKEEDSNKWFKVSVTPKNSGAGRQDKSYSEVVIGAVAPVVSDVRLIGNATTGSTISVSYKFNDANGDAESGSSVEWYVGGNFVSTGSNYSISSADAGKSIYAVVTPRTSIKPTTGAPVPSETKTISKASETVNLGGGGAGGGGFGGGIPIPNNINTGDNGGNNTNQKGFSDTSGHWAESAISKMVDQGIIFGKSANEFAPEDKITRAEFAALISRMFKLADNGYKFNDVSEDSWYSSSVAAVAEAGFMKGSYGDFRPEDNMTREEMAVVISAIASEKGIEGSGASASFTDFNSISNWAKDAVNLMADIGIIKGMDDNSFMPKGEATRAQTVMMLTRLQEAMNSKN